MPLNRSRIIRTGTHLQVSSRKAVPPAHPLFHGAPPQTPVSWRGQCALVRDVSPRGVANAVGVNV